MSLINVDYPNYPGGQPGPQAPPAQQGGYNLDLFDLIKRKFWIILFFTLAGIALSMLYFFKAPKTYQSTAKIFVDEKNASVVSGEGEFGGSDTSVEQYMLTVKSTKILSPSISNGKFHEFDTFAECDDVLRDLRDGKSLAVKPADSKTKSGVIQVAFSGSDPEECQKVLEEIIASFDEHIKSTTRHVGGASAELVQKMQNEMLKRLQDVEQEIQTLNSSPEVMNVEGRIVNPHQLQLSMLMQDLHDIRRERVKLDSRVKNILVAQQSGRTQELVSEIIRENGDVNSAGAYTATHDQYLELKVKEQELLSQFAADHPELKSLRSKIALVEGMRAKEFSRMNGPEANIMPPEQIISEYVSQLRRQVATLMTEEDELKKSIKDEQLQSTSVAAIVEKLNTLQRERERLEKGYYTIVEQLSQINALKEHLWRNLSVLDPPSFGEQVAPSLPVSGAAGLFIGSLLGLLLAAFKDMAEKTFRSSDDIAGFLNTRVIGHVNFFQKMRGNKLNSQFPNVKPELVAIHNPSAMPSESYRAIRTAIFFRSQETGAKVIQITSPAPGDGKSTTIANLAASIAQSGRRVLLMDADLRRPVQNKMFGMSNEVGLSSVIQGECDLSEAIEVIQPKYLSVLPAGPVPANPAELLTSSRFEAVMNELREHYDFILVDTPPVLAVTDPTIVCNHVDLVYFVMRIRNGVKSTSTRAKEILDSMGVELGGIIINGLRRRDQKTYQYSGQYGYGGYKYESPGRASGVGGMRVQPHPQERSTRV
jgi:capsular exopolysaccharide synthesis family protein